MKSEKEESRGNYSNTFFQTFKKPRFFCEVILGFPKISIVPAPTAFRLINTNIYFKKNIILAGFHKGLLTCTTLNTSNSISKFCPSIAGHFAIPNL